MGWVEGKGGQWTPGWLRFILWLFAVFLITTCEAVNYEGLHAYIRTTVHCKLLFTCAFKAYLSPFPLW